MRLRTLPLTLASIGIGGILAFYTNGFNQSVFWGCVLTTLFLQILSNLANEYGDFIHGADHDKRDGPSRTLQLGLLSAKELKLGIVLTALGALISGILLLLSSPAITKQSFFYFLGLCIAAIIAAYTYTACKKPYGYAGLGDLFVFIFFGPVAVLGTYYLQAGTFQSQLILPAITSGLFAVTVLNINNIRDIDSDKLANKRTIPVRIGKDLAIIYQWFLIIIGLVCMSAYFLKTNGRLQHYLFLLSAPLFFIINIRISRLQHAQDLDPYLKKMVLSILLYSALVGIGIMWPEI